MKRFFTLLFVCFATQTFAQNADVYWAKWNKNYPEQDITQMLKQERFYADSVEKHPDIAPTYLRRSGYRFNAQYLGKIRPIDADVLASIIRVNKVSGRSNLEGLLQEEVLFKIGEEEIWMPIQPKILSALKEEVKAGETTKLYCAYFNEHTMKGKLYNTFFISEFSK